MPLETFVAGIVVALALERRWRAPGFGPGRTRGRRRMRPELRADSTRPIAETLARIETQIAKWSPSASTYGRTGTPSSARFQAEKTRGLSQAMRAPKHARAVGRADHCGVCGAGRMAPNAIFFRAADRRRGSGPIMT